MVRVTLYVKKVEEKDGSFDIQRIQKKTILIDRPKTYKEFEKEIITKFNIIGKDFAIKVLLSSNDEENIKDEDSYNDEDYKKSSQYIVILDEEDSDEKSSDKVIDNNLNIDSLLDINNELFIDENELDKILSEQINNKKNNIEKNLNKEENDINVENNKLINSFLDNFKKEINSQTENKKKSFINSIKKEFYDFEHILDDKINIFNKNLKDNITESEEVKKKMSEMKNYISFIVPDQQLPIMFNISSDKKEYEIFENEAFDYQIPEIKIENILNKKVNFKNKYWIRDEKSDPDIYLPINKNDIDISQELGINESKYYSAKISIKNPKIGKSYFLKLYIGDNTLNSVEYQNVTKEALFFNIKIKEKEEEEDKIVERKLSEDLEEEEEEKKPIDKNIENNINLNDKEKKEEQNKNYQNANDDKEADNKKEDGDDKKYDVDNKNDDDKKKGDDNKNKKGQFTEEEVEQLYDELEDEFYVSSILTEEEMKKIIRDNEGRRDEIKKILEKQYM